MDASLVTPARLAAPAIDAAHRRIEPWMWLEEDAESARARTLARPAVTTPAAPPACDADLADGLEVLDVVDDLVAAVIDTDELAFSRGCEALFRRVVGTRCLAALAARRLARVVHSRWFPVLMRVTPRRQRLCMRLQALHRTLTGMVDSGPPPTQR